MRRHGLDYRGILGDRRHCRCADRLKPGACYDLILVARNRETARQAGRPPDQRDRAFRRDRDRGPWRGRRRRPP
ncbi:hypothetical protein ACU4GD_03280 [Cupriavidus basilensis]